MQRGFVKKIYFLPNLPLPIDKWQYFRIKNYIGKIILSFQEHKKSIKNITFSILEVWFSSKMVYYNESERFFSEVTDMSSKKIKTWVACAIGIAITLGSFRTAYAEPIDYNAEMESRKLLPVQTNQIDGWPKGPEIGAQAAILMEASTGTILYAKNIDERLYPASTTKIMTCLLAIENAELDEMVTFSETAVFSIDRGSSNIGMDAGQSITMEQALNGILILSANEVANAVGEHIAGDADNFVNMMNARVEEMGLQNTHFCNAHGLHDDNHYTSARDLALIAREFFSHETLAKISGTTYCTFEATATQPDSFSLATKNQLVKGKEREYEYLVGSKTGYTSIARQTLVSCAKKDGMELICVIMKEESPYQFTDTIALFDYGFQNFTRMNIAANDTTYTMNNSGFFTTGADIFGNSKPFLALEEESYVVVPNTVSFADLNSRLIYESAYANSLATVEYSYRDNVVGRTYLQVQDPTLATFAFGESGNTQTIGSEAVSSDSSDTAPELSDSKSESENADTANKPITNNDGNSIFINVKIIIIILSGIVAAVVIFLIIRSILRNYHFARRRRAIMRRTRTKYRSSEFDKYKFK